MNSLVNLRDVGGLPLVRGGVTRPGVLYRGDAPYVGDTAPSHVPHWPPSVVVDLRSDREVAHVPFTWPVGTRLRRVPLHEAAIPENIRASIGGLDTLYEFILDTVPHRVAAAVEVVAAAPAGPVLVHCAAGKDRTGIVVAALLLAGGVHPAAIVADYVATADNMGRLEERWLAKGVRTAGSLPLRQDWLRAPAEAVGVVVSRLEAHPGKAIGWLTEHGSSAASLERWVARLTGQTERAI